MKTTNTIRVIAAMIAVSFFFASTPIAQADSDPQTLAFLQQFWNDAWGLDFVEGQSGLLLEDAGGAWGVLVCDTGAQDLIVAQGSYVEAVRLGPSSLAPTQEQLAQAGIISFDHFVVAGTVNGSTGFQGTVFGLATIVVTPGLNPEDPPIVAHGFTPLALTDTLEAAVAMASDWWQTSEQPPGMLRLQLAAPMPDSMQRRPPPPQPTQPPQPTAATQPTVKPRNCAEEERLCRESAYLTYQGNRKDILADTTVLIAGCAVVCWVSGPLYPGCMAVCGGAALTSEALRLSAENDRLQAAYLDCAAERLRCNAEAM